MLIFLGYAAGLEYHPGSDYLEIPVADCRDKSSFKCHRNQRVQSTHMGVYHISEATPKTDRIYIYIIYNSLLSDTFCSLQHTAYPSQISQIVPTHDPINCAGDVINPVIYHDQRHSSCK